MPQDFHIVQCKKCTTYQVDIIKKVNKWICKLCGEKQTLGQIFGNGVAKECRLQVQKLNDLRRQKDLKEASFFISNESEDNDSINESEEDNDSINESEDKDKLLLGNRKRCYDYIQPSEDLNKSISNQSEVKDSKIKDDIIKTDNLSSISKWAKWESSDSDE